MNTSSFAPRSLKNNVSAPRLSLASRLLSRTSSDILRAADAKAATMVDFGGVATTAGDAFGLIGIALYNRFEKEDEIDRRIYKEFADCVEDAPKLTRAERALVKRMLTLKEEVDKNGQRFPGTGESERGAKRRAARACLRIFTLDANTSKLRCYSEFRYRF